MFFRYFLATFFLFVSNFVAAKNSLSHDVPQIGNLQSKVYLLIDANSGEVLAGKGIDMPYYPASLTKIMTGYIVSSHLKKGILNLQDKAYVSKKAWERGGSRMFLRVGSKVSINELLKGLVVQSGNDAAIALAEHIAGTEEDFVGLMNRLAERLGMTNTHFVNATGWPHEDHISTARDLATLTRTLIKSSPELYKIYSTKYYTYNNIKQANRNSLLWEDDSVDGVKTGHTDISLYNMVASAERNRMRLIAVVLGAPSKLARARDSLRLLNYGFRYYVTKLLYKSGQIVHRVPLWKGKQKTLDLKVNKSIYVTVHKQQNMPIKAEIEVPSYNMAPIAKDANIGSLRIQLPNKPAFVVPITAAYDVKEAGLFSRLIDMILLFFYHLFGIQEDTESQQNFSL